MFFEWFLLTLLGIVFYSGRAVPLRRTTSFGGLFWLFVSGKTGGTMTQLTCLFYPNVALHGLLHF
jgi:hypothetical protein